jgi:hypothetical protein
LLNWWKIDTLAVSGTFSAKVTLPFASCAFTPFTMAARRLECGRQQPEVGSSGIVEADGAAAVCLIHERYAAPIRVCGVACHRIGVPAPRVVITRDVGTGLETGRGPDERWRGGRLPLATSPRHPARSCGVIDLVGERCLDALPARASAYGQIFRRFRRAGLILMVSTFD